MRGPYLVTALPQDLSGLDTELIADLHRIALARGRQVTPKQKMLLAMSPLPVCVIATTLPDQMRLSVSRLPGAMLVSDAALIFITADGHNYLLLDTTVAVAELKAIVQDLGAGP